jgi:hypothetical protein
MCYFLKKKSGFLDHLKLRSWALGHNPQDPLAFHDLMGLQCGKAFPVERGTRVFPGRTDGNGDGGGEGNGDGYGERDGQEAGAYEGGAFNLASA